MSDTVWISDLLADPEVAVMVNTDISVNDVERSIEGEKLLKAGKPVPRDLCPRQIWNDETFETPETFDRMPDVFIAHGHCIVSERAADVLRQFDLGGGALYPLDAVLQKDRKTPVPGEYFCWIFGNVKEAFLGDESPDARPFVSGLHGEWKMPFVHRDGQLAVSTDALRGPDVWVDPRLFKSVFVSGPLGNALDQAGLREAFRLFLCRVL